jgi:tRNA(Ile)-lysidine synthase
VKAIPQLKLDARHLKPGMRVAIAVSGGADSVALLRALHARAGELGLVLSVAHLHHGLRGAEADADLDFVRELAERLGLQLHQARADTATEAERLPGKRAKTIEEAARRVRYAWFRTLMVSQVSKARRPGAPTLLAIDAVATAHTLDDQAETVLAKFLRGAWTEGLSGIHPVVEFPEGRVVRPLLGTTRAEVEAYLRALGQDWREDSTNRHLTFTRNRIRHELLPLLEGWNPRLREHLSQMAELAREEESRWEGEIGRLAAGVILEGRPVRGGGRAAAEGLALDLSRLEELHAAVQRRVIRYAAARLGCAPDFEGTKALRALGLHGRAGQKCELASGLRAERTHRELRLSVAPEGRSGTEKDAPPKDVAIPIPGERESAEFGLRVRIEIVSPPPSSISRKPAVLRNWRAGDRVQLRYSSTPKKVKEVLERLKISGAERRKWPVVELGGRIAWMQGVAVEPEPGVTITVGELKRTGTAESA